MFTEKSTRKFSEWPKTFYTLSAKMVIQVYRLSKLVTEHLTLVYLRRISILKIKETRHKIPTSIGDCYFVEGELSITGPSFSKCSYGIQIISISSRVQCSGFYFSGAHLIPGFKPAGVQLLTVLLLVFKPTTHLQF